jgi:hypothetical protein
VIPTKSGCDVLSSLLEKEAERQQQPQQQRSSSSLTVTPQLEAFAATVIDWLCGPDAFNGRLDQSLRIYSDVLSFMTLQQPPQLSMLEVLAFLLDKCEEAESTSPQLGAFPFSEIVNVVLGTYGDIYDPIIEDCVALPGGDDDDGGGGGSGGSSSNGYFHRDTEGNSCFSGAEAARSSAYLAESAFLEQVQQRIRSIELVLPQTKTTAR